MYTNCSFGPGFLAVIQRWPLLRVAVKKGSTVISILSEVMCSGQLDKMCLVFGPWSLDLLAILT